MKMLAGAVALVQPIIMMIFSFFPSCGEYFAHFILLLLLLLLDRPRPRRPGPSLKMGSVCFSYHYFLGVDFRSYAD